MKRIILFISMILLLFSCETDIDITLPEYQDKLVVEARIENGKPPTVLLTKSMEYFSPLTANALADILITNAVITVTSTMGESAKLQFGFAEESPFGIGYTCSPDVLQGTCNTGYTLKIELDNKIYTATTSIPNTFDLDSIWLHKMSEENDSISTVRLLLSDNASTKDYYQFTVKVRGPEIRDYLWAYTLPIVFDDATFNGITFNFEVLRVSPSTLYAAVLSDEEKRTYYRPYYKIGDTIMVKRSLMDYASYRFWASAMFEINFGGGAFMTPPPIESNIKCSTGESVLGSWCGFASKIDTLVYR